MASSAPHKVRPPPQLSRKDCVKHLQAAIDCLLDQGTMAFLPVDTVRTLLKANPSGGKIFADQIKSRAAEWALGNAPVQLHAPYAEIIDHLDLLGEFRGGPLQAIELCANLGTKYFELYWFMDGCEHHSKWVAEGCARFDRAFLRQLPRVVTDWDGITAFDTLFTAREREDVYLDRRHAAFPDISRAALKTEEELISERTTKWYFPMTRRFLREIHSKQIAFLLLPKITGQRLPSEILEIISEYLYDQDALDIIPELAKVKHDVWDFDEDSEDD